MSKNQMLKTKKLFCFVIVMVALMVVAAPGVIAQEKKTEGLVSDLEYLDNIARLRDNSQPVAITPTSKWYGVKVFFEGVVEKLSGISHTYKEKYLSHLSQERTNEFVSVVKNSPTDYQSALKAVNGSYAYQKKLEAVAQKDSPDRYWETTKNVGDDLYRQLMAFDFWLRFLHADDPKWQESYAEAKNQLLIGMLKKMEEMRQAAERVAQEKMQKLLAERAEAKQLADYLSDWAEKNKERAQALDQIEQIKPEQAERAKKAANDFAEAVKKIKDSPAPDKEQLQKALNDFKDELKNLDQERLAKTEKKTEPKTEPPQPIEPPQPDKTPVATNNKPAEKVKEPVAKSNPPAPAPAKPKLKPLGLPDNSRLGGPITMNIQRTIYGETGTPFMQSFCWEGEIMSNDVCTNPANISGGKRPYHFVLGSGSGFPAMGTTIQPNGEIVGTPSIEGTSHFTVCVVDLAGLQNCQAITMIIKKGKEKAPEPTPEPTPVPTPEPAPAPEPVAEDTYTITYTKVTCIHKAGEEDYYHKGYYVQVEGTMSGPVGSYVTTPNGMGDPKCGWSKCTRQAGDPETSTWTVTLPSRAESWWYAIGIEKQGDLFYRERTDFSDICLQSPPPAPVDTCDTNAFNRAWMDCNHNSCSQPYQDCANSIPSDASNYYELDHQCALQQCECYKQCGADLAQQMGCLDHYKPSSCN